MKWIVFTWTCSESCDDLELYKRMVSYVMAYSFTEPPKDDDSDDFGEEDEEEEKSTIYMVPMADMLNHIANNNAHLSFKPDCLEMIATKDIKKVYSVHIIRVYITTWFSTTCTRQHVASQVTLCSQFIDFIVKWTLLDILGRGGV